jgi:hypothetical protein
MAELSEAAAQAIAKEDGDAVRDKVRAAARVASARSIHDSDTAWSKGAG